MTGWATAWVMTAALWGQGGEPKNKADQQRVDEIARLVQQLDAATVTAREEAEAKLLALGPEALPALPETSDAALSAEARKRLARVRAQLEQLEVERAVQATTVSLAADNLDLAAALEKIESQTGNRLIDYR